MPPPMMGRLWHAKELVWGVCAIGEAELAVDICAQLGAELKHESWPHGGFEVRAHDRPPAVADLYTTRARFTNRTNYRTRILLHRSRPAWARSPRTDAEFRSTGSLRATEATAAFSRWLHANHVTDFETLGAFGAANRVGSGEGNPATVRRSRSQRLSTN